MRYAACYEDSFTWLYVDDARTSQETYADYAACYGG
jgi:predicted RNA-binding Zn ribbon-like protein